MFSVRSIMDDGSSYTINLGNSEMTTTKKPVSQAKPKAEPKKKPTKQEQNKAAIDKMRQVSLAMAPTPTPTELVMMPLGLIETRAQVRTEFNDETLAELAADIAANGVMQPILLRPNPGKVNFIVSAGERRFRAAQLAQLESIPAIIGEVSDEHASAMQIAENIQREDLSLADTAKAVRKLYDVNGSSVTDTAAKLHKSKSWVSKHLAASCPDLRYMAKEILEGGFTEDLEIILILDKLQLLDWSTCRDLCSQLKEGKAGRQTVKDAYAAAKAKDEERKAEQEAAAETDEQRETREAKQKADNEKWKKQWAADAEKRRLDPDTIRWTIDRNASSEPDEREALDDDEREQIEAHLGQLYEQGRKSDANDYRQQLMQMIASELNGDGYAMIELAAFTAGFCNAGFDLDTLFEELYKNAAEVC